MKHWTILNKQNGAVANPKAIATFFNEIKDGKHIIESKDYNKRSDQQNRYLHGILIPEFRKALNDVGYDAVKTDAQSKLVLKKMFLTRQVVNKETGEVLEYVQNTSDLTKEELNILIEEVIKFAAENMNYVIPYPNEQTTIDYEMEERQ
jgi:hypothetical protein